MSQDFMKIMTGAPPAPANHVTLKNWRDPGFGRWSFSHVRQLLPTAPIAPSSSHASGISGDLASGGLQDLADLSFTKGSASYTLDAFLKDSQSDCFMVMQDGKLVYQWFDGFGAPDRQHIVFSVSKSITSLLAGVLAGQGVVDVERDISSYLPEVAGSAYDGATIRHLLDMTIASAFVEDYLDTTGVFMAYRRASAWNPIEEGQTTNGLRDFLAHLPASDGNHGHRHHYCSTHTDMLGWVLERAAGLPINELFSTLLFAPSGTRDEAYITVESFGAPRVAGGICLTAPDLLRLADMTRCGGAVGSRQIVPESWINDFTGYADTSAWQRQIGGSRLFDSGNYRSKWYQTGFEDGEYCAIGIHGQWIWINPKRGVTIIRMASRDMPLDTDTDTILLEAFKAVARAVSQSG